MLLRRKKKHSLRSDVSEGMNSILITTLKTFIITIIIIRKVGYAVLCVRPSTPPLTTLLHLPLSLASSRATSHLKSLTSKSFPTESSHLRRGLPFPRLPPTELRILARTRKILPVSAYGGFEPTI